MKFGIKSILLITHIFTSKIIEFCGTNTTLDSGINKIKKFEKDVHCIKFDNVKNSFISSLLEKSPMYIVHPFFLEINFYYITQNELELISKAISKNSISKLQVEFRWRTFDLSIRSLIDSLNNNKNLSSLLLINIKILPDCIEPICKILNNNEIPLKELLMYDIESNTMGEIVYKLVCNEKLERLELFFDDYNPDLILFFSILENFTRLTQLGMTFKDLYHSSKEINYYFKIEQNLIIIDFKNVSVKFSEIVLILTAIKNKKDPRINKIQMNVIPNNLYVNDCGMNEILRNDFENLLEYFKNRNIELEGSVFFNKCHKRYILPDRDHENPLVLNEDREGSILSDNDNEKSLLIGKDRKLKLSEKDKKGSILPNKDINESILPDNSLEDPFCDAENLEMMFNIH